MATLATIISRRIEQFDVLLGKLSFSNLGGVIRDNILFFLWIVLVPLLMLGVRQGGELLTGLFDYSGLAVGARAGAHGPDLLPAGAGHLAGAQAHFSPPPLGRFQALARIDGPKPLRGHLRQYPAHYAVRCSHGHRTEPTQLRLVGSWR